MKRDSGLMSLGTLYAFLYCCMAANMLLRFPIIGGALYLVGKTTSMLLKTRKPLYRQMLSAAARRNITLLGIFVLLMLLFICTLYPLGLENADFWRLGGLVLSISLRYFMMKFSLEKSAVNRRRTGHILLWQLLIQLLFLPPIALMLFWSPLPANIIWSLLLGYIGSGLLEFLSVRKVRFELETTAGDLDMETAALKNVHAYRMFQYGRLVFCAALQVTQILTYTYIAVTSDALLWCMLIALICTYGVQLLTVNVLEKWKPAKDPTMRLLFGTVLWLAGLILFASAINNRASVESYFSLALCTMGATFCMQSQTQLADDIRRVEAFGLGHEPSAFLETQQHIREEYAELIGQSIALIGLILICAFTVNRFPNFTTDLFRSFRPLLTVPALLLVLCTFAFAFAFPLTEEHLEKLRRYTVLRSDGGENRYLHDQLEAVVIRRSLKHYGVRVIMFFMRPFYRHRILGRENLHFDEDIPCVFICNHGEIYGPIVTNLYIPYSFRPWVTYEMADPKCMAEKVWGGFMQNTTGRFAAFRYWLLTRFGAPFMGWILRSVECIPVYHDDPKRLRQTFKDTMTAMQAGDNILIFPEDPIGSGDGKYLEEGVSEFFTGFAMIGQMYAAKTGKCPQFIPIYASKKHRTITFGVPTRYDDSAAPADEKERLCAYLRGEMIRIWKEQG